MRLLAMFWVSLKHVWYNRKLELGLLLGLTVAVAVASSIPIYTSASLQRGLMREWLDRSTSRPPFALMVSYWGSRGQWPAFEAYDQLHAYLESEVPSRIDLPQHSYLRVGSLGIKRFQPTDPGRPTAQQPFADVWFISNLEEVATIVDGRWAEPGAFDDPYHFEVVVDEASLEPLNLLLGGEYIYMIQDEQGEVHDLHLHIVGVFRAQPEYLDTTNWVYIPPFDKSFIMTEGDFFGKAMGELDMHPETLDWYWVFDYEQVQIHQLPQHISQLTTIQTRASQILPGTRYWSSPLTIFQLYQSRARTVSLFLLALSLPILGMVFYYVALTAGLAVGNRANEIAMLRSRGAAAYQVILGFFIEWSILAVVALLIGPYIGLNIARVMGASAGFLTFVDRVAIPAVITPDAIRYGLAAAGTAVLMALIPTIPAMKHSIVTFKSQLAQRSRMGFWHKYFLDAILLAGAFLGYRQLQQNQGTLASAAGMQAVPIDPMLFLVPFLFTLGGGILCLRIFPWFMALLSWLTARWSSLSWSLTTRQLARNPMQYAPLLLLLMVTVSLGIYSASAARTLDRNFEDRIGYRIGADVVLQEQWRQPGATTEFIDGTSSEAAQEEMVYEPPFYVHEELPGVEAAARVMQRQIDIRVGGSHRGRGQMLATVPHEFAAVTWFRDRLLPGHLNQYLNVLLTHREGALVSRAFLEANNLQPGDWIELTVNRQPVEVYVAAPIDYWPTLDPAVGPFFVVNLEHVQEHTAMEPYNVWLRLTEGAQMQEIVDGLRAEGIYVIRLDDARRELIEGRRDPLRMGFFGILSIGFAVSVVATVIGFFLFNFLSMRNRTLQFGVLRAMGLSLGQLIASLGLEGIFTVGVGVGVGTILGRLSANYFLPFLELGSDMSHTVPPFIVVIDSADLSRIYTVLLSMLIVGVAALAVVLVRVRLHQAVKLGEEA